tara:strand:- start:686 stop:922 length:237 start_codon:yes stop_codon:yes gene_type:complete
MMNRQRVEMIAGIYGSEVSSENNELVLYTRSNDLENAKMIQSHFPKFGLTISLLIDRDEYIVYTGLQSEEVCSRYAHA